jgi:hypothetical protein
MSFDSAGRRLGGNAKQVCGSRLAAGTVLLLRIGNAHLEHRQKCPTQVSLSILQNTHDWQHKNNQTRHPPHHGRPARSHDIRSL